MGTIKHRDGWQCLRCGRKNGLQVHHRIKLAEGGLPFAPQNLETTCRACHYAEHRNDYKSPETLAWAAYLEDLASAS